MTTYPAGSPPAMASPLLFEATGDGGVGTSRDFWWDDAVAIENHEGFRALQRRHDHLLDQQRNVDHM